MQSTSFGQLPALEAPSFGQNGSTAAAPVQFTIPGQQVIGQQQAQNGIWQQSTGTAFDQKFLIPSATEEKVSEEKVTGDLSFLFGNGKPSAEPSALSCDAGDAQGTGEYHAVRLQPKLVEPLLALPVPVEPLEQHYSSSYEPVSDHATSPFRFRGIRISPTPLHVRPPRSLTPPSPRSTGDVEDAEWKKEPQQNLPLPESRNPFVGMTPPLSELRQMSSWALSRVEDFSLTKITPASGEPVVTVQWLVPVDLRGTDLTRDVAMVNEVDRSGRRKWQVELYPGSEMPMPGSKLNCPALVTFFGVFCPSSDPEKVATYPEKLRAKVEANEFATFVGYEPRCGNLSFRIAKF